MKKNFNILDKKQAPKLWDVYKMKEKQRHIDEMLKWYMKEIRGIKDYKPYKEINNK